MEIIIKLLSQLATSLSPIEFLMVLLVVVMASYSSVKFIVKNFSKRNGGLSFLSNDESTIDDVNTKVDTLVTKATHDEDIKKILSGIDQLNVNVKEYDEILKLQIAEIRNIKVHMNQAVDSVVKDLNDIRSQIRIHDMQDTQASDNLNQLLQRNHELMNRIVSQIEKIDEFARASIPEFRSYHKELSKEVGELSRDIALVERSVQTQINTNSAIKLR